MARSSFPRRPASEGREVLEGLWDRISATVRGTLSLFVISFALGVAIWIFVTEEENPSRSGVFPGQIEVMAVNVGPEIAVANVLSSVDIRIEAPEDRWDDLTRANFRAIVDLNGLSAREQIVPVSVEVTDVRGVRIVAIEPESITVNLEEIVTRSVPVGPRLIGSLPRGFAAGDITPARLTAEISGPQNLVELVVNAAADVNVAGLTVGVSQTIQLVPRGTGGGEIRGVTIDPPELRVEVAIEQTLLKRLIPLAVDLVGEPALGYRVSGIQIQPGTIAVEGNFEVLQSLEDLSLGQILLDGLRDNLRVIRAPTLPPGVSLIPSTEIEVIVSVIPIRGDTILTIAPGLMDVPEGFSGDLGNQTVSVVVEGALPILNALVPGDIRAEVGASSLTEGASNVAVRIVAPSNVIIREVRPSQLTVTLEAIVAEGEE